MVVVTTAKATAGFRSSLNADDILTPDAAILRSWQQSPGNLRVIVKLLGDKQPGDVLSLRSGYDASKITPDWKESIGEIWLDIGRGTTTAQIQEALRLLTLESEISGSASTRKVWVFPTVSGVNGLRYRFDKEAGLVRHYGHKAVLRTSLVDGKIFARLIDIQEPAPNPIVQSFWWTGRFLRVL